MAFNSRNPYAYTHYRSSRAEGHAFLSRSIYPREHQQNHPIDSENQDSSYVQNLDASNIHSSFPSTGISVWPIHSNRNTHIWSPGAPTTEVIPIEIEQIPHIWRLLDGSTNTSRGQTDVMAQPTTFPYQSFDEDRASSLPQTIVLRESSTHSALPPRQPPPPAARSSTASGSPKSRHGSPFNGTTKPKPRYLCHVCSKSHARASRATACANEHLGVLPFVCTGGCGESTCRAAFGNKERLQAHQQPRWKTHITCPLCGKSGWRRNAERHQRSCVGRHKHARADSIPDIDWELVLGTLQSSQESEP